MCRPVSGKVWETEGSSRESMTATQQSSAVVSESHQLLLVSVVGEGTVQVTQAGTRRKDHSQGILGKGCLALLALTVPGSRPLWTRAHSSVVT